MYVCEIPEFTVNCLMFIMCSCLSDEMEFEVTSDQRTGKPIACRVVRLEAGSVSFEVCSLNAFHLS